MATRFKGRVLLADDLGLGKTIQSLTYAKLTRNARPIVVVCPAGLKYEWQGQAREHVQMRAEVLEGMRVPRRGFRTPHQLIVVNFEILKAWLPFLRALKPRLVIVDECHRIMNRTTQCSKNVRRLCKGVRRVIMISATPLINRPAELYPALHILRPDVFPEFFPFAMRYCSPKHKPWGWEFKGAARLDELNAVLKQTCMIRRLKEDVMKDLPPISRIIVPLEIEDRKQYLEAMHSFMKWIKKHYQPKAAKAQRAEQLVKAGYILRLIGRLKLKYVHEWIDAYLRNTDQKLLVFGVHKKVLRPLAERYGRQAVIIDGDVTGRDRQKAQMIFNKAGSQVRLLFGNIKAAGVGWSAKCPSVAKIELGWTPGIHLQAEGRCHGMGRGIEGIPTTVFYLVARDTMEESLCRLLQKKQADITQTLDGTGKGAGLDVFDLLMRELAKQSRAA